MRELLILFLGLICNHQSIVIKELKNRCKNFLFTIYLKENTTVSSIADYQEFLESLSTIRSSVVRGVKNFNVDLESSSVVVVKMLITRV